jgi:hypothetical protein
VEEIRHDCRVCCSAVEVSGAAGMLMRFLPIVAMFELRDLGVRRA